MDPERRAAGAGRPVLAYVEHHLPGRSVRERLALARRHGLALEVAHRGDADLGDVLAGGTPIVTLQAYGMHDLHPLHPDPERRRSALAYVEETIDLAAAHGIPRVLTACGFGERSCDQPFESCLAFYRAVVPLARRRSVRVLIELLSPLRAPALTDPAEFRALVEALDAPDDAGVALDLGHLADAGHDPIAFLRGWPGDVVELQLRGPGSTAPAADVPVRRALEALGRSPEVVCVEHRRPIGEAELARLVAHVRGELG